MGTCPLEFDLIERDLPHVLATTFNKNACDVLIQSANIQIFLSYDIQNFWSLGISATKDYVLMSCSATEIPMLRECQAGDELMALFSIISKRPRVVCLLDSTCVARWRFDSHGSKMIQVHPEKVLTLPLMIAQRIQIAQIRFRKALGSVGYTVGLFYYHYLFHQFLHFLSS